MTHNQSLMHAFTIYYKLYICNLNKNANKVINVYEKFNKYKINSNLLKTNFVVVILISKSH